MNLSELKKLIRLFEGSKLSVLEVDQEGSKVVLKKAGAAPRVEYGSYPVGLPHVVSPSSDIAESALPGVGAEHTPEERSKYRVITSPMVGTFYRASSPTSPPYIEEGDTVRKGQILCIIEAMKLMNEIECEIAGKVIQVFPESGKPVEFGEPLFEIDPT